jgi:hypothetical protein
MILKTIDGVKVDIWLHRLCNKSGTIVVRSTRILPDGLRGSSETICILHDTASVSVKHSPESKTRTWGTLFDDMLNTCYDGIPAMSPVKKN